MSLRRFKIPGDVETSIFSQPTLEGATDEEINEEILKLAGEPFTDSAMREDLQKFLACFSEEKPKEDVQKASCCLIHFLACKRRLDLIKATLNAKKDTLQPSQEFEFFYADEESLQINSIMSYFQTTPGLIESNFSYINKMKLITILTVLIKGTKFKFLSFTDKFRVEILKSNDISLLNKLLKYSNEERLKHHKKKNLVTDKEIYRILLYVLLNFQKFFHYKDKSYNKIHFKTNKAKIIHDLADPQSRTTHYLNNELRDLKEISKMVNPNLLNQNHEYEPGKKIASPEKKEENFFKESSSRNIFDAYLFFAKNKTKKLSSLLFRCHPHSFLTQKGIEIILKSGNSDLLLNILDHYPKRLRSLLTKPKLLEKALDFLSSPKDVPLGVRLFFHIRKKRLTITLQRLIMIKFANLFENAAYFSYYINPALLLVMVSFALFYISKQGSTYSLKIFKLAQRFRGLAKEYIITQSDLLTIKYILMKKFNIYKLPLVEILYQDREFFYEILTLDMIPYLICDKYNSAYKYEKNYFVFSTAYNYLTGQKDLARKGKEKNKKIERGSQSETGERNPREKRFSIIYKMQIKQDNSYSNLFKLIEPVKEEILKKNNYIYQFLIFKKSFSLQMSIDLTSYLLQFSFICMAFASLLDVEYKSIQLGPETFDIFLKHMMMGENPCVLENFAGEDENKSKMLLSRCFDLVLILKDINTLLYNVINAMILTLSISFKRFSVYLYSFFLLRKVPPFNFQFLVDFLFFCISFVLIQLYFSEINGATKISHEQLVQRYSRDQIFLSIVLSLMWIKLGSFLKLSKYLGMLKTSISYIIVELIRFVVIWILLLMGFSSILNIILRSYYKEYNSFFKSFQNLLAGSLKVYVNPYALIVAKGAQEPGILVTWSFAILFYCFLFLTVVVLTNFFVAIMTTTYLKVVDVSEIIHSWEIYQEMQLQKFNKFYGSLVILPTPLNLINIITTPLLIFFKSIRLNTIFSLLGYGSHFAFNLMLFSFFSLLFIPLAWIKIFFLFFKHAFILDVKRSKNKSNLLLVLMNFVFQLLCWVLFGNLFLIYIFIFNDLYLFIKLSVHSIDNRNKFPLELSYDEVLQLLRLTKDYINRGMSKIKLKQWRDDGVFILSSMLIKKFKEEETTRDFNTERNRMEILKGEFEKIFETYAEDSEQNIDLNVLEEVLKTMKKLPRTENSRDKLLYSNYLRLIDISGFKKAFNIFKKREERMRISLKKVNLTGFI